METLNKQRNNAGTSLNNELDKTPKPEHQKDKVSFRSIHSQMEEMQLDAATEDDSMSSGSTAETAVSETERRLLDRVDKTEKEGKEKKEKKKPNRDQMARKSYRSAVKFL